MRSRVRSQTARRSRSKSAKSNNYKIQSIVVPIAAMSKLDAEKWIRKHYKLGKIEEYANTWRFRQIDPKIVEKQGYTHYKIKKLSNGVELVLVYKHPRK